MQVQVWEALIQEPPLKTARLKLRSGEHYAFWPFHSYTLSIGGKGVHSLCKARIHSSQYREGDQNGHWLPEQKGKEDVSLQAFTGFWVLISLVHSTLFYVRKPRPCEVLTSNIILQMWGLKSNWLRSVTQPQCSTSQKSSPHLQRVDPWPLDGFTHVRMSTCLSPTPSKSGKPKAGVSSLQLQEAPSRKKGKPL